jgi:NADPH-ferrihemoprotein reductase
MEGLVQLAALAAALVGFVVVLILKLKGSKPSGLSEKGAAHKLRVQVEAVEEQDSKPVVRILYGTQTGTAERFSKALGNELRRKYGSGVVVEVRRALPAVT